MEFANGQARLWDHANSAVGGYLNLYHEIPYWPTNWTLTVEVYIDQANFNSRPVPEIFTQAQSERFPGETSRGIQVNSNQMLVLRDPVSMVDTNYQMHMHMWHSIEVFSTPNGSELRAWPSGTGSRPSMPLATGISLEELRHVFFACPNYQNFDWSVGMVKVECHDVVGPVLGIDNFIENQIATLTLSNASALESVGFAYSLAGPGPSTVKAGPCGLINVDLGAPIQILATAQTNSAGVASITTGIPNGSFAMPVWVQALDLKTCQSSNGIATTIGG